MVVIDDERLYQAFYTKSTAIVDYMISKLLLNATDKVFEPCGGDGVFIEAILAKNKEATIDICELNPTSVAILKDKFRSFRGVTIRESDTLLDDELSFKSTFGGFYDKIIANPPYGAWQDFKKRAVLKKMYVDLYVKESYALFLYRCIELLKDDGMLTFIIPDTFLNLHTHKALRKHILSKTKIVELVLFPSSFFPGVNFGYANLSIITLQKSCRYDECMGNIFNVISNFTSVEELSTLSSANLNVHRFTQKEVLTNPDYAFFISDDANVVDSINKTVLKIGDIAHCVTGFYSGDDKTFLQVSNKDVKNGKNYQLVEQERINQDYKNTSTILDGINGNQCFVPIVKGGNTKYLKPETWFMNWSKEAVEHYKSDKKARFQNPKYYFQFGIGVPMISSSSITAALIENKLFDQSIVGIFPKDESLVYYLLAFFNSPTCNKLIRTINPSANNPANYLKKIPFIEPSEEHKAFVTEKVKEILTRITLSEGYESYLEMEINQVFITIYGF